MRWELNVYREFYKHISISSSQTGNIIDVTLYKWSDAAPNETALQVIFALSIINFNRTRAILNSQLRLIINHRYTSVFKLPLSSLRAASRWCYHALFSRQCNVISHYLCGRFVRKAKTRWLRRWLIKYLPVRT